MQTTGFSVKSRITLGKIDYEMSVRQFAAVAIQMAGKAAFDQ